VLTEVIDRPPVAEDRGIQVLDPGASVRRRLRIAMVHMSDFRYDSRVQRQARALAERGDEVDLICVGEREQWRVGEGVIRAHPVLHEKVRGGARAYLSGYGRFLSGALSRLTRLELIRPFDVVVVHNMPDIFTAAAIVPRLRGAGVILDVHDTFPELFATKFGRPPDDRWVRMLRLEERFSAALADRVVTVTDEARLHLERRGVGTGRSVVVMNSPDERAFGPPRPPLAPPATGPVRVLYHGGTARRFGVQTLIEAFAELRDHPRQIMLRVCGAGADGDRLRKLADELAPGQVEIASEVPCAQIPAELAEAHLGVVPTLSDSFTELLLPVKLLEDVHMGLPVIASRLRGISSYFSDEEVRLVAPGNPHELAVAIGEVCADPGRALQRALRAQDRLAGIAWEQQCIGYLALVDELAEHGSFEVGSAWRLSGRSSAGGRSTERRKRADQHPPPQFATSELSEGGIRDPLRAPRRRSRVAVRKSGAG
jgi:glycosyltransferase involved in cell wall biosynthesis